MAVLGQYDRGCARQYVLRASKKKVWRLRKVSPQGANLLPEPCGRVLAHTATSRDMMFPRASARFACWACILESVKALGTDYRLLNM